MHRLGARQPAAREGRRDDGPRAGPPQLTKIVQGWPKLWANFSALIGIFSQKFEPSLAIWANPVQFSCIVGVDAQLSYCGA